jgi:hypothetical protein
VRVGGDEVAIRVPRPRGGPRDVGGLEAQAWAFFSGPVAIMLINELLAGEK